MQVEKNTFTDTSNETWCEEDVGIEDILSVWPIISCFALYVSAGDLISLSRTSSTLRALTHGFPLGDNSFTSTYRQGQLRVGDHQTTHWTNLKASSRFECSSPTHLSTKQHPTRPCRFCSRPICKACIVRIFFANPRENTFKHRTRYLCPTCWESGNLRKDFRYPIDHVSREHIWRGRSYTQRGGYCSCAASSDNWLCIPCKNLQNASAPTNQNISEVLPEDRKGSLRKAIDASGESPEPVKCFGLDCSNDVFEADRERRRICLWCSKALARQYAGEDRLRWESRQVEIRAAAAASRSADIAEWARNRFRSLTMSRREMRGSEACLALTQGRDSPEHDRPMFVRHLDAVNYRRFMIESNWLSPDSVYQSKHGRWTYTRAFLLQVNERFIRHRHVTRSVNSVTATELFNMTHTEAGLFGARTNLALGKSEYRLYFTKALTTPLASLALESLRRYQAVLWDAGLVPLGQSACQAVMILLDNAKALDIVIEQLMEQVDVWNGLDEIGKHGWRPPSLKFLVEDAEQSLKIRKSVSETAASSVDDGGIHADRTTTDGETAETDAYANDLNVDQSNTSGKGVSKHEDCKDEEEYDMFTNTDSESESESEVDLTEVDSNSR